MPFGPPLEADASRYVRAAPTISEAVAHVLKGVVALAVVAALHRVFFSL